MGKVHAEIGFGVERLLVPTGPPRVRRIAVTPYELLAGAKSAGNEKWNDPYKACCWFPVRGPGFIPFLIPYLSHQD